MSYSPEQSNLPEDSVEERREYASAIRGGLVDPNPFKTQKVLGEEAPAADPEHAANLAVQARQAAKRGEAVVQAADIDEAQ